MTTQNDAFTGLAGFTKEALEPLRAANGFAADVFERLSRQNYAVAGDCLDFAVEQARLSAKAADYREFLSKQADATRSFGEQIVRRSREYMEIVTQIQAKAGDAAQAAAQNVPTPGTAA